MTSSCPFLANIEAQERLVEARYKDGVSEVFDGAADPVTVSMAVFDQDGDIPNDAGLSTLFTTFGQFLDHDMVLTPEDDAAGHIDLIGMPHDMTRSQVAEEIGEGETIAPTNAVTWQIDGSQIYGSTEARMDDLRSFEGGKLRMQDDKTSASELLPDADEDSFMAGEIEGDDPVHLAGDIRANENPNLLSMQTMFVREHNYWADRLAAENPDWDDQQLYTAARSIVEFELQQITYNEWLPHLIGTQTGTDMADYEGHDPDAIGEMSVEFSTAAFRFGHTLVSSSIDIMGDDGTDEGSMALMEAFFNHSPVEESGIDALIRGQLANTAQALDAQIVDDLNFFLFTEDGGVTGFSLAALNLARGLDHGLESYVETRAALLGDIDPATLDPQDFSIITSDEAVQARLAAAYDDVFQVDLWTGGLAEDAVDGTQLGPLFTYIVADQFNRTRAADETFGQLDPALGAEILAELQGSTFATIIERTTDVDMVQGDVFVAQDRNLSDAEDIETTWFDDEIALQAEVFDGDINTGNGDDTITLTGGSQINGDVNMGKGDDTFIASSGDLNGDLRLGNGDDTVTLEGTAVVHGDIRASLGDDTITLKDMAQSGSIMAGDGDDTVALEGRATVNGELCTGSGEDTISLGARTTVTGSVNAGKDDDLIIVESGAQIDDLHGSKGFDTLQLDENARFELNDNGTSGTVFYLDENGDDTGEGFEFRSIERITCFTLGTLIITERGKLPIEQLEVGDRVWTLDAGLQPIAWMGRATVPARGPLAPILIKAGAMGNGRDLLVSPQHRMMLDGWRVEMHCGADEILAPAKALTNDSTIRRVEGGEVTYIHIAFDSHQIVMAEGIPSESFFPGGEAMSALDQPARDEILALFPEWACPHLRPKAARPVLTPREARILL